MIAEVEASNLYKECISPDVSSYLNGIDVLLSFKFSHCNFIFLFTFIAVLSFYRYDREEGNTMFDEDSSSFFLGDEATFKKKETELAKKLVCFDSLNLFFYIGLSSNFQGQLGKSSVTDFFILTVKS